MKGIKSSTADYPQKNSCKSNLASGASCTIDVSFDPIADGRREGTLILSEQDPASPQTINLAGYGIGIGHQTVFLHYDYMVAPDHTDDPEVVAPGAIQRVVNAFAAHGIDLVIDPHHTAIPAVPLLVFDYSGGPCYGLPNFSDLRAQYFTPKFPDQHYVIFGDYNTDQNDYGCSPTGSSGVAQIAGENFLVTLRAVQLLDFAPDQLSWFYSGAFMHELGHNFGLHHGGGFAPLCCTALDTNWKPNFISTMNYYFNLSGIPQADAIGSINLRRCSTDADCPDGGSCISYSSAGAKACYRLDYSRQLLPTGGNTPGALDENNLNEPAGLGSGNTDITFFTLGCTSTDAAASNGPIDWDGDGNVTGTNVVADVDFTWTDFISGGTSGCNPIVLPGWNEWASLLGTSDDEAQQLTTQTSGAGTGASSNGPPEPELDLETARRMHVLLPLRPAPVVIEPGCRSPARPVLPYRSGTITVALLATEDFDPDQVELSSLIFHDAKPVNTWLQDVNGDGIPDLVMQFRGSDVHLSKQATKAHLRGFLGNSQAFVGERDITIASDAAVLAPACR